MKALVQQLKADGFTLTVNGQNLKVSPSNKLTDALRKVIRANKAAIIAELSPPPQTEVPLMAKEMMGTISAEEFERLEDERQALIESRRIDAECARLLKEQQTRQIGSGRVILSRRFARD
jgi:hypothetical protein